MYSVLISDKKPDRARPAKDKNSWESENKEKSNSLEVVPVKTMAIDEGTRKPKKVDDIWTATMNACGINQETLNTQERKKYNTAVKLLKESSASVDEIFVRVENYKIKFPGAALTPMALASHWSSLEFVDVAVPKQVPTNWDAIAEARKQRGA
jgi:hypothetical protein